MKRAVYQFCGGWGKELWETSPLRVQSHRRRGETRGGRVPQKIKIWGDVFYGWSLSIVTKRSGAKLRINKAPFM